MKGVLLAAFAVIAVTLTALPSEARKTKSVATPSPIPVPAQASGPMGYYLMAGRTIISPAYPNTAACYKDLAAVKRTLAPGTDTLVCVHRHP